MGTQLGRVNCQKRGKTRVTNRTFSFASDWLSVSRKFFFFFSNQSQCVVKIKQYNLGFRTQRKFLKCSLLFMASSFTSLPKACGSHRRFLRNSPFENLAKWNKKKQITFSVDTPSLMKEFQRDSNS